MHILNIQGVTFTEPMLYFRRQELYVHLSRLSCFAYIHVMLSLLDKRKRAQTFFSHTIDPMFVIIVIRT